MLSCLHNYFNHLQHSLSRLFFYFFSWGFSPPGRFHYLCILQLRQWKVYHTLSLVVVKMSNGCAFVHYTTDERSFAYYIIEWVCCFVYLTFRIVTSVVLKQDRWKYCTLLSGGNCILSPIVNSSFFELCLLFVARFLNCPLARRSCTVFGFDFVLRVRRDLQ